MANKVIWTGLMKHINLDMKLNLITETVNGEQFVHGSDSRGPFMALLHRHNNGEEWFHGPGMQAMYMRNFHD